LSSLTPESSANPSLTGLRKGCPLSRSFCDRFTRADLSERIRLTSLKPVSDDSSEAAQSTLRCCINLMPSSLIGLRLTASDHNVSSCGSKPLPEKHGGNQNHKALVTQIPTSIKKRDGSQNGSWCGLAIMGILLTFVEVKRNSRVRLGVFAGVCESPIWALPSAGVAAPSGKRLRHDPNECTIHCQASILPHPTAAGQTCGFKLHHDLEMRISVRWDSYIEEAPTTALT
jgi:hypothetical protein